MADDLSVVDTIDKLDNFFIDQHIKRVENPVLAVPVLAFIVPNGDRTADFSEALGVFFADPADLIKGVDSPGLPRIFSALRVTKVATATLDMTNEAIVLVGLLALNVKSPMLVEGSVFEHGDEYWQEVPLFIAPSLLFLLLLNGVLPFVLRRRSFRTKATA